MGSGCCPVTGISIHVPLAGDDPDSWYLPMYGRISIHVPLAGDDLHRQRKRSCLVDFYPRPPCGGRRRPSRNTGRPPPFLSTSPLRGTTDFGGCIHAERLISIHVPLAGDDLRLRYDVFDSAVISIHVPLAGDDSKEFTADDWRAAQFLSTSPLRGTTSSPGTLILHLVNFYPRPPCGGRPLVDLHLFQIPYFYPRPPCGGRRDTGLR